MFQPSSLKRLNIISKSFHIISVFFIIFWLIDKDWWRDIVRCTRGELGENSGRWKQDSFWGLIGLSLLISCFILVWTKKERWVLWGGIVRFGDGDRERERVMFGRKLESFNSFISMIYRIFITMNMRASVSLYTTKDAYDFEWCRGDIVQVVFSWRIPVTHFFHKAWMECFNWLDISSLSTIF